MNYSLLERINDKDIPYILDIYKLPSVSRFVSIDEENYWRYVTDADNVRFYKVYKDDSLVAAVHLESDRRILYMSVVVFPDYQRNGIAAEILKDIISGKLGLDFESIRVSIDEKNTASLRLFEKMGFVCTGKDEELMDYEYIKS